MEIFTIVFISFFFLAECNFFLKLNSCSGIKGYIFFVLLLLPFFSWMSLPSDIEIVSEDETLNEFSGARAHEIVRELAREPRTLGSNAHETSQIYIKRKLIEMGCSPQKQSIVSATQTRYSIESAPIENIFCILKSPSH